MDFQNYTKMLQCKVQLFLGNSYEVMIKEVVKNNGIVLTGILAKNDSSNIFPTIYINQYFDDEMTVDEIEYLAMKLSKKLVMDDSIDLDIIDDFTNYEMAKSRIAFKLINAEKNKELLLDIPHRRFHNLAVCYYYLAKEDADRGSAFVLIRDNHIKMWGVEEKDLYNIAYKNTIELLSFSCVDIMDMVRNLSGIRLYEDIKVNMYVLTGKSKLNGAAAMLYNEYMKEVSEMIGGSFYILPSSIHEIIILSEEYVQSEKELLYMVSQINRTEVEDELVLADSVYYYDAIMEEVLWVC